MAQSDKTEKATPKKKKDERKKGNAYQSKDVVSVILLFMGFFLISQLGLFIVLQIRGLYQGQMAKIGELQTLTVTTCMQILRESIQVFFIATLPIVIVLAISAIIMVGVQTGFLVSGDLIKFKHSRISLMQGIKRLFSLRSLMELAKSIVKVLLVLITIYTFVKGLLTVAPDLLSTQLNESISYMGEQIIAMVTKICLIFSVVAILDYAYQKYDYEKKLMMTKQEIKDEYKQSEGDPQIKGKIKEKQRQMSQNRMMQQVPTADVIVRNPTHFAIALKYDIDHDAAPIIIAKGKDSLALRIVEVGEKHNVPIKENRLLARGLYEMAEVNDYIPAELYQAVAELIAWVYSEKEKGKGAA
ncbi:flagellar biosynthesis protein FlhB [Acetobacterium bakii]|uniref:Flagellar biosynthetic protein FlhB n=1 Tax=Acetobacterium bakii TaxID=52689 RepID=A0A0L6U297_9FIRM|nr:flagellar biosynthesis protein FlhB [Acetobacterium bakii]KNZ42636.1 flagellar biosynthesis protein FlhB [Acetobacterium bakii]